MVCTTDANIWIDLDHGDLLDEAFRLPFEWTIPDLVFAEVKSPDQALLTSLGLVVRPLSGSELNRIIALNANYPAPSPADLAVLVAASVDGATVITGDGPVRSAAKQEGLSVHGLLWILDQMVADAVVTASRAAAGLTAIIKKGAYLPPAEVERRLQSWSPRDDS